MKLRPKHQQPGVKELRRKETFEKNFKDLTHFLDKFKRFPKQTDHLKLYNWICSLRIEHKKNQLEPEYIGRLNSIGFIWDKHELSWFSKAEEVRKILTEQKRLLTYANDTKLYSWLQVQLGSFHKNALSEDRRLIISEINELIKEIKHPLVKEPVAKISTIELKWQQKLNDLILFRKENPKSWPKPSASDEKEKKLGIWCQSLRARFKKGSLDNTWISKLKEIGFSFDGYFDHWKDKFEELKIYLETNNKAPDTKSELYSWAKLQFDRFDELRQENQELLHSINFLDYFEEKSWDKRYSEVQEFITLYKEWPTKKANEKLYNWIRNQRTKYKAGELDDSQISSLLKLGIDFSSTDTNEDIWNSKYEALIKFRENNPDRWPSFYNKGAEKKLYEWCQAQRQVYAKTAQNRKDLSQDRIDKLNKIGFHWSLEELNDKNWNENFQKLQIFISSGGGSTTIPTKIDGKANSLYKWWLKQKTAIKKGKLSSDKIEKLKSLGVI